jgi:hypothetical protein
MEGGLMRLMEDGEVCVVLRLKFEKVREFEVFAWRDGPQSRGREAIFWAEAAFCEATKREI